jgi:predicted permease
LFQTLRDAGGGTAIAAYTANPNAYTLALPGQSGARAPVEFVSWNYFDTLGVAAQQGRVLAALDDQDGAPLTVVLAHGAAINLFGDAESAIGEIVAIDGYQFAVIGVTDRGFRGLSERAAAFVPMSAVPTLTFARRLQQRMSFWHQVVVRGDLPPGVAAVATAEFSGGPVSAFEFSTMDLRSARGDERTARTLWVAFGGVFALVLLACANAANLVLMRGTQRLQEFAVRIAMGADRNRLLREQLVEGAVVAVLATVVAVLFAGITVAAVRQWTPGLTFGAMSVDTFAVDARMVLAAAVIAVVSVLLSFLAPAFLAARRAALGHRDLGGRGSTAAIGARRVLVGVEIALATVLLVGAVLFLRSAMNLQAVDLGYRTDGVVIADVALPRADYRGGAVGEFHTAALEQIAALPGVTNAAFAFCPPPAAACDHIVANVDGGAQEVPVVYNQVSASYFDTLAIPVVRGRGFGPTDTGDGAPVIVVSERAARELFGSVDAALGGRVTLGVGLPA